MLLPIVLGMLLGNMDSDMRAFLKPGESLPVPFFAFALGAGMNFATFFNPQVVAGGLVLGVMTVVLTGAAGMFWFWVFREKSLIAPVAEASTAGNAVGTCLLYTSSPGRPGNIRSADDRPTVQSRCAKPHHHVTHRRQHEPHSCLLYTSRCV